jgi:NADH-quinone oxidoreductase subunit M
MTWIAGLGILIGIAFSWRALQATFFGEPATAKAPEEVMPPISVPERLGACLLLTSTIVLGLYPRLLMDLILPALNGPLFEQLRQGGWR